MIQVRRDGAKTNLRVDEDDSLPTNDDGENVAEYLHHIAATSTLDSRNLPRSAQSWNY